MHSLSYWYPLIPAPFKRLFFSQLMFSVSLYWVVRKVMPHFYNKKQKKYIMTFLATKYIRKGINNVSMGLSVDYQLYPFDLYFYPHVRISLDHFRFVVRCDFRNSKSSNFVLLFHDYFCYLWSSPQISLKST